MGYYYLEEKYLSEVKICEGYKNGSYKQYKQWKKGETIPLTASWNIKSWLGCSISSFSNEICYIDIIKWKNV